mgnify:CR=1 FL=1
MWCLVAVLPLAQLCAAQYGTLLVSRAWARMSGTAPPPARAEEHRAGAAVREAHAEPWIDWLVILVHSKAFLAWLGCKKGLFRKGR